MDYLDNIDVKEFMNRNSIDDDFAFILISNFSKIGYKKVIDKLGNVLICKLSIPENAEPFSMIPCFYSWKTSDLCVEYAFVERFLDLNGNEEKEITKAYNIDIYLKDLFIYEKGKKVININKPVKIIPKHFNSGYLSSGVHYYESFEEALNND